MSTTVARAGWPRPGSGLRADVALAAAVTGVMLLALALSSEEPKRAIMVAYGFALAFGLLMLVRRQHPVLVAAITCSGLVGYYAVGMPAIGLALPVAAALYTVAENGRLWAGVVIAACLLVVTAVSRLSLGQAVGEVFGQQTLIETTLLALVLAVGYLRWSRLRLEAEQEEVLRRRQSEQQAIAARRVAEQRERLARDLHDEVGHNLVALVLHADAAMEALDADDPDAARRALIQVQTSSRETMTGLRRGLRPGAGSAPEPRQSLIAVEGLVERLGSVPGVRADLTVEGDTLPDLAAACSDQVQHAIYRAVQESLTNAFRHGDPDQVEVRIARDGAELEVEIADRGSTPAPVPQDPADLGGIASMRSRIEGLGGILSFGPTETGFAVRLRMPITGPNR